MGVGTSCHCECEQRVPERIAMHTQTDGRRLRPGDRARRRARDAGPVRSKGAGTFAKEANVELSSEAQPMHAQGEYLPNHETLNRHAPVYLPNRATLDQNLDYVLTGLGDHYRLLCIIGGPGPMETADPNYFDD
eukprot:TRINITY_DN94392_c0_g1_i1.p1 TRINITY_DN94392_c0_g1~~TRINITY_DN94392_c0_g1_i1.p1  ORF type:complete len:134 (-),score=5.92 TRINITY_DN94392_c0_g1_i1:159-560(-)